LLFLFTPEVIDSATGQCIIATWGSDTHMPRLEPVTIAAPWRATLLAIV
jgi:hypothetical protein